MPRKQQNIRVDRRHFLHQLATSGTLLGLGILPSACGTSPSPETQTRLLIPKGIEPRIIARSGQPVLTGNPQTWHVGPDGGGTMALDDGSWIYVSSSESKSGSISALRFGSNGTIIDHYSILQGSRQNCSGTMTPWNTWLSCEEISDGIVWECDPFGIEPAKQRLKLGVFKHESACVDPISKQVYLTEDKSNGRLYRFTPDNIQSGVENILDNGQLAVAQVENNYVTWLPINDPLAKTTQTRFQQADSKTFKGGEGICYRNGSIYFTTKGDNRIWSYNNKTNQLKKLFSGNNRSGL